MREKIPLILVKKIHFLEDSYKMLGFTFLLLIW